MTWESFTLNTCSFVCFGGLSHVHRSEIRLLQRLTFSGLTCVLAVGNRFWSLPASRMAEYGLRFLESSATCQLLLTTARNTLARGELDCNLSQIAKNTCLYSWSKPSSSGMRQDLFRFAKLIDESQKAYHIRLWHICALYEWTPAQAD